MRVRKVVRLLVDEVRIDGVVQFDGVPLGLPVGREDHDGFWLHLLGDLLPNALEHGIYRMFGVILDARLGVWCEMAMGERDRGDLHHRG